MLSLTYMIGILLLIFILPIESNYYVYTYDDDNSGDEHCCLVRLGEKFCVAQPLTRSLLEVNKKCPQLGVNEKNKKYLNKIVRRLNVETSTKVDNKILLELQKPLEEDLLKNDLLCLSADNNNIDLGKCYVQLAAIKQKKGKQNEKNEILDDEHPPLEIELPEPVYIHTGHGLSVRPMYELNLTDFRATREQRNCWSWYRKNAKNILNYPRKSKKICTSLTKQADKCLHQLFYEKLFADEQGPFVEVSTEIGSKLYCENNNKQSKLLGYHRRSEICFTTHYQAYIDHKFTDLVSLSDKNKNKDVLKFISNNTKLTNEFESDCKDKKTLDDIKKLLEEEEEAEAETNTDDDNDEK